MPTSRLSRFYHLLVLSIIILPLTSCMGLRWKLQAIGGHFDLLSRRTAIEQLVADPDTDPALRAKLRQALEIREFASAELGLPDNDSYRSYADLQRPAAVWNVIAAPPGRLEAHEWCFLFAGCVPYRGWFREQNAWREARKLYRKQGLDVMVSPAVAYSTLGWFDDPLLNTMLDYSLPRLADLLFHELAHQQLFIKGDANFNEAYATAVAEIGVRRWLDRPDQADDRLRYQTYKTTDLRIQAWISAARADLERIYQAAGDPDRHRLGKQAVIAGLRQRWLAAVLASPPGSPRRRALMLWRDWFAQPLNNAHFVLHATYRRGVASLLALYACLDGDLERFYAATEAMQAWTADRRRRWLNTGRNPSSHAQPLTGDRPGPMRRPDAGPRQEDCITPVQQPDDGLQ